ncbi:cell wall hydrolase/autolysin [Stanieria cyanosphaera PCC 7437]|uniref:Cell wall hydrolase/autolysin n=1 Tax=Stanieria cyanosphaera (strain ATCC 29371 / PCC 7437) TaxID=111780 RepID=K9XSC6_STAC7|nr:N-acetylmuramoyl-L-alanine amidase [Stanieria cyanosphaera]AFZ34971.1 cell wall hydrolase/autolysin [Stanieria cyanosphaera PCC 7437]
MKKLLGLAVTIALIGSTIIFSLAAQAQPSLYLAYPPPNHETIADKIFLIGTASSQEEVLINGKSIARSKAGHFAPSFPLKIGDNVFEIRHQNEKLNIKVKRISTEPEFESKVAFAKNSLTPATNITRLPNELICFSAISPPNAEVKVKIEDQTIPLSLQTDLVELPANSAIFTNNQPTTKATTKTNQYQGCTSFTEIGNLGQPEFELSLLGETITQTAPGEIEIISPTELQVVEITAETGVTRTGPSTNYSRLTPLPKGVKASVTGTEGEWLRLDYGAWIKAEETKPIATNVPSTSLIRSIASRQLPGITEIVFPLQIAVPFSVKQGERTFTLTLYNTTAQTDTIRLDEDPVIKRLDWQQVTPTQIDYTFHLNNEQQWGYEVRYQGTSLVLSLRHPPQLSLQRNVPLIGVKILLDPGHGGKESGAKGPTGYPEKDINLLISTSLAKQLERLGATVDLTRTKDIDLALEDRVKMIDRSKPAIALSIHYNALPDDGDAMNTKGISTFWYHSQAHSLAVFLQNYLVNQLNRPSHGVYWNNLALTRPHTAPAVLLELGFMINPDEFEWITNPTEQTKLVNAIASGITEWFTSVENCCYRLDCKSNSESKSHSVFGA